MKKIFLVLLLVGTLFLTACKKIDSQIIGTWEYNDEGFSNVYVFKKDGTGTQTITVEKNNSIKNFTYETKYGKLLITYENDTDVFELGYRFSKGKLVLKDTSGEEFASIKK